MYRYLTCAKRTRGSLAPCLVAVRASTTRNLEFPKYGYVRKTRIIYLTALCSFTWLYSLLCIRYPDGIVVLKPKAINSSEIQDFWWCRVVCWRPNLAGTRQYILQIIILHRFNTVAANHKKAHGFETDL